MEFFWSILFLNMSQWRKVPQKLLDKCSYLCIYFINENMLGRSLLMLPKCKALSNQSFIHNLVYVPSLKLLSAGFHFFFFCQIIALKYLWKMLFVSSRRAFSFSRYSVFHISVFVHCLRERSKINLKVYNVINCLNLVT